MVAFVTSTPNPKVSSHGGAHQQKQKRPPLLPSDAENGVVAAANRRPKSREVTSRYLSSTSSSDSATSSSNSSSSNSSTSRRCPSPLVSRTRPMTPATNSSSSAIKRSQSVDRRRPATTPRPSTPEISAAAKVLVSSKRSLSVSFQGDSFSLPIGKTKPAPSPSPATSNNSRKTTPERRRATPAAREQTENSKPIDQHRWPGRSREVLNSTARSLGSEKTVRAFHQSMNIDSRLKVHSELDANSAVGSGSSSSSSSDPSDGESVSSGNNGAVQECGSVNQVRGGPRGIVVPARFWQETTNRVRRLPEPQPKLNNGLKKSYVDCPIVSSRGLSPPLRGGVRPSSPSKIVTSPSRGMLSPSRVRNNNDLSITPSILSFATDVRRVGKVGENRVVDAHMLRLLHNRHLQWRLINARADAATSVQRATAEKSLYKAWVNTSKLWQSVKTKRVELQVLRRNLKLYFILKGQMLYLDDWDLIDRDHSSSLSGATEALEASTLRLPVVGGARADIQNVKDAICSAVDVMQSMASSIRFLLPKVDEVNSVASELANVTAKEHALLDQCKDLMSALTAMQVKDFSLRTHILQLRNVPS